MIAWHHSRSLQSGGNEAAGETSDVSAVPTLPLLSSLVLISSAVGQLPAIDNKGPVLLYAPESNRERQEFETLHRAKSSVDIAIYGFIDREIAEELCRLARNGVRVRVYRDAAQVEQESERGSSTTECWWRPGSRWRCESIPAGALSKRQRHVGRVSSLPS